MNYTNITFLKPHISLNVKNIAESVEFYKLLFGIDPLKFIPGEQGTPNIMGDKSARLGYAKFDLNDPPLNFVLNETTVSAGGSLSHLGLQVDSTEDVLKIRERWIAAGIQTADEMQVDCCYALQDKTWARDPDGNEWEVFTVIEDTHPKSEACACGSKVSAEDNSMAECCTDRQKASTIAATSAPCC